MKRYEQDLLNNLEQNTLPDEMPLKNVKEGLGEVAFTIGNPLTKTEITLNISLYFGAWNGVNYILTPPAALPAFLNFPVPVSIFGLTDYYGGNHVIRRLLPSNAWDIGAGSQFGIYNYNYYFRTVTTAPPPFIIPLLDSGDMLICYGQLGWTGFAPNVYAAFIIIHCDNVAYGTFLHSFVSDLITVDTIRMLVPIANINQYVNPLVFATQSLFGKVKSDSIDPRMYQTSKDFQNQIADIPINLPIDKSVMIAFGMDILCPTISMVLFVKKVEPLTHKY
jgi:hypothetical protein